MERPGLGDLRILELLRTKIVYFFVLLNSRGSMLLTSISIQLNSLSFLWVLQVVSTGVFFFRGNGMNRQKIEIRLD